jgi:uncharacterized protein YggE
MSDSTPSVSSPVWALLLAVAIGGGFYVYGQQIQADEETPALITVSGDGRVFAVPDIAELSFGVQTGRQRTAKEAMEKLKLSMEKVFAAVQAAGVEEKDIRTEYFSLNPAYDWTDGTQVLRGYEASQSLRVKVRDLDNVSAVLAAATAAGANQAGSVNFTIDDPEELRMQARQEAILEAQEKAKDLANQLGVGVAQSTPLPAGEQEIQVDVSLTYEID